MINSKRFKIPRVMDLLRNSTLLTLQHNMFIWAEHIPSKYNDILFPISETPTPIAGSRDHCLSNPIHSHDSLNWNIQHYITCTNNTTHIKLWEKTFYCLIELCKRKQFPANEVLLTKFVAFLAKSIKYPSIKVYLAAVRHCHIR